MRNWMTAAIAGVAAGVVTTAVMVAGRKTGALHKTLDRDAVDWIDRTTGSRAVIGDGGTSAVEFANHLGASAAFAVGYDAMRRRLPDVPWPVLATVYGGALYGVNIAGIAPVIGITEGERQAGARKAAERLAVHLLQTLVTAALIERQVPAGSAPAVDR